MFKLKESENQPASVESKPVSPVNSAIPEFLLKQGDRLLSASKQLQQQPQLRKFVDFYAQLSSQHIAMLMVFSILIAALIALHRPVNEQQFLRVVEIAQQTQYVSSQKLAQTVLQRPVEDIRKKHVLKLNAALQYESKRIQHYEPVQTSPIKTEFEYPDYP